MNQKPDCLKCQHYYITWKEGTPKGCRAYQFESLVLPSIVVKQTTGTECLIFEVKTKLKNNSNLKTS